MGQSKGAIRAATCMYPPPHMTWARVRCNKRRCNIFFLVSLFFFFSSSLFSLSECLTCVLRPPVSKAFPSFFSFPPLRKRKRGFIRFLNALPASCPPPPFSLTHPACYIFHHLYHHAYFFSKKKFTKKINNKNLLRHPTYGLLPIIFCIILLIVFFVSNFFCK